jgi:hypothetical protein
LEELLRDTPWPVSFLSRGLSFELC